MCNCAHINPSTDYTLYLHTTMRLTILPKA